MERRPALLHCAPCKRGRWTVPSFAQRCAKWDGAQKIGVVCLNASFYFWRHFICAKRTAEVAGGRFDLRLQLGI